MGWGEDSEGQLGNGAAVTTGCECLETPTAVVGLSGATQISGGEAHALALLSNGTVMAWGQNKNGQLGDGEETESLSPVAVKGLSNVVAVAAGGENSLALLANGTVMAWGENAYGELGNGGVTGPETCTQVCSKVPVQVPGLSNVIAIAANDYYNLALLSNGTVMAWGYDYYGEVGDGKGIQAGCDCIDTPTPVPGISGAVAVSAGSYVGEALLQDGTVKDWGYDYQDELGSGTTTKTEACECLGPVSVTGVANAKAIAAGGYSGVAELASGALQSWGYNYYGTVGNGTTNRSECECVFPAASVIGLSNPQGISAGSYHDLALLSNGTGMSWGENEDGQLGDGTVTERDAPVAISGLSGASAISGNDYQSFALIGPSQGLTVALAGAGTGAVAGPAGILCPSSCAGRYPQGQVEFLRATPATAVGFAGFSGPCAGTGTCQVKMEQDQTVTATFGPPKGTAITAATISNPMKKATFSFTAPGAITGFECMLVRPKPKKKKKKSHGRKHHHRALSSGAAKPPSFGACSGPQTYKNLGPGGYTFEVRALDILGADAVPATQTFKIKTVKKKKKKHHHGHKH